MKSIRALAVGVVAVLSVVGLAACGGGGGSNAFCDDMKPVQAALQNFNPFDEQQLNNLLTIGAKALQSAPGDIKPDIQKLFNAVNDQRSGKVPNATEVTDSIAKITIYTKNKCNIDLSPPGASSGSESSGSEDAAKSEFCNGVSSAVVGQNGNDPSAAKATYDKLKDLEPPSSLKADWSKLLDALSKLGDASPSDSNYPQLQADFGAALGPVVAYYGSNCLNVN